MTPLSVISESTVSPLSLNLIWTLLAGFLVMFMQAGFALVETGMCRAKNAAHTMSMNFLVYSLSMAGFFVCGFAFMCGGANGIPAGHTLAPIGGPMTLGGCPSLNHMLYLNIFGKPWGLIGLHGFFLGGGAVDAGVAAWFFYMMVFMDTTATIPTGALAERWSFKSFTIFSVCVGSFIYTIFGCWMWGGGWLAQLGQNYGLGHGAADFAGSGVVHLQGGALSLILVKLMGPRIGKYDSSGNARPIFGHHMPMVMLGTLVLAFGWFGFNAGSGLSGNTTRIAIIAVNTMLASGAASLSACFFMWKLYGKPDPTMMCNGMLGGLVSVTAGCAFVTPMTAVIIGLISGIITVASVLWFERNQYDDPVGAISVHGIGGVWGLIAVGLFADGSYGEGFNGVSGNVTGLFYGDHSLHQLYAQLIAAVTCIAWNVVVGGGVFLLIERYIGSNRVPPQVEIAGLDIPEMGTPGYPEFITQMSREQVSLSDVDEARA
jgi:Amt family ammonium transporter